MRRQVVSDNRFEPDKVSALWIPGGDYDAMLRLRSRRGSNHMARWMLDPKAGATEVEDWGAFRGAGTHFRSDEETFGAAVGLLYPMPKNSPGLVGQFPRIVRRTLYLAGTCSGKVGFLTERGVCFVNESEDAVAITVIVSLEHYLPLRNGWTHNMPPYERRARRYLITIKKIELVRCLSEALEALRFGIVLSALNLKAPVELRLAIATARARSLSKWLDDDLYDFGIARWGKWPDGDCLAQKDEKIKRLMGFEGFEPQEINL